MNNKDVPWPWKFQEFRGSSQELRTRGKASVWCWFLFLRQTLTVKPRLSSHSLCSSGLTSLGGLLTSDSLELGSQVLLLHHQLELLLLCNRFVNLLLMNTYVYVCGRSGCLATCKEISYQTCSNYVRLVSLEPTAYTVPQRMFIIHV